MIKQDIESDFLDFLRSSATNVERLSDGVRQALNVVTGIEDVVRAALREKRDVVIAGTAGSGKTHLLRTLGGEDLSGYRVVPDLAALPQSEWSGVFGGKQRVIVAGNEGAFLQGAGAGYEKYAKIVSILHETQRGELSEDRDAPVVIDVAAFDPAGSRVLRKMLRVEMLLNYIRETKAAEDRHAWEMLLDDTVVGRLESIVDIASSSGSGEGFTFRQLWKFIGELVGGNPSKFWFEKLNTEEGEVATRISHIFFPNTFALPHIGNHMWHGDMAYLRAKFLPVAQPLLELFILKIQDRSIGEVERTRTFDRLRLLALFGLKESPLDQHWRYASDLWTHVRQQQVRPLIEAINKYLSYGLIDLGDELECWCQHDAERRSLKPSILMSLGRVPSKEFEIVRSRVFNNLAMPTKSVLVGCRYLLRHTESSASVVITKDLLDSIGQPRSFKTDDRLGVEYDWRILRFVMQVASKAAAPDKLRVIDFDFLRRSANTYAWQISPDRIRRVAN